MEIRYNEARQRFEAATSYAERFTANPVLKAAGFAFDGRPGIKVWHTAGYKFDFSPAKQALLAARLAKYADGPTLLRIGQDAMKAAQAEVTAVEESRATDAADDVVIPCPEGLAYLGYQRGGIVYARPRRNVLIADEMGLGKTIQGIGISNDDASIRSILIECPASLKLNWAREWVKWDVKGLSIAVVVTSKPTKKAMARLEKWGKGRVQFFVSKGGELPNADVVIINYDILDRFLAAVHTRNWNLILVDEAHYLKNPKAKRTQAMLGRRVWDKSARVWVVEQEPVKADRRVFLTGTPIVNRPCELWPFVLALDPEGLGKYKSQYEKRYCAAYLDDMGFYHADGADHLDELQLKLRQTFMVRRLKADVLKDLPPKRRNVVVLESDGLEDLIAREAAEYADVDIEKGEKIGFTSLAAARKAVALAKVPAALEFIDRTLENTDKVVVMAHHYEVVDALLAHYGKAAVGIDGREADVTKREAAVEAFQTNPEVKVFVGTIKAAGVGITLTAASTVVFVELDWVPGNVTQAEDRVHRIGQKDSVLVYHLVLDGSIDANIVEKIITKQAIIDKALDNRTTVEMPPVSAPAPVTPRTPAAPAAAPKTDAPVLTPEQIAAVHSGLRSLAGMCDGARQIDGHGFNKLDSNFGKSLAGARNLTQRQAVYGQKLVRKYQGQLPAELVKAAGITLKEAR